MKKIILILSGIFIYNFLFAQNPFYKKGNWGADFGLNYYCPTIDKYQFFRPPVGLANPIDLGYSIEPIGGFGEHIELFRTIKLNKNDNKNLFNALIGLSYNQRRGKLKCKCINRIQEDWITEYKKEDYLSLDIKLNSIVNIKKKYGVSNAIGFRTNITRIFEYYLTYSLGFLFYSEKTNIMPYVDFEIIDFRKKYDNPFFGIYPYRKEYYNLINFGISIFFNKPLKNKKNEEK